MTHALTFARAKEHLTREEGASVREQESGHTTVLLREALELLAPEDTDYVIDATLGLGGHSEAILVQAKVTLLGIDADPQAIAASSSRLGLFGERVKLVEGNFRDLEKILHHEGIEKADKVLFDLGWNSTQMQSGRGFSFRHDEPLSMSYGKSPASGFTAREILNEWDEKVLADVLYGYGEERYARRIAKAIIERRALKPIETTIELAEIIKDAVPALYRHGRIHPATRTFQALRIAVNDELGSLEKGIAAAWKHLAPNGRIAVITFHSIEDRIVKKLFAGYAKEGGTLLVKKPLIADSQEISHNPSARSAKLRGIQKI
ncbi:16S rRNA (cytosine(1402)-N(4))-methyltransferase RsmH [Acetobacteraceae bacterium]|nr:16S rRNA (cytosine(1402)-N(4))-methyltransferase RsmH [Candidatus Parcubacteria bacterium]